MDKKLIAKNLLDIKAVFLRPDEPFTWSSGIKSPIYCDNRLTLSYPDARDIIENALADMIEEKFPDAEMLMGTSTAGIAHAAIVGHLLELPMGYVRGSAKNHGRNNRIEGALTEGMKVVVIEDLISTAGSAIETADALVEAGAEVLGIVSIFTYGMKKGLDKLAESGYENYSICDLDELLEVAWEEGYIEEDVIGKLKAFRDNPSDESWMEA